MLIFNFLELNLNLIILIYIISAYEIIVEGESLRPNSKLEYTK